MRPVCNWIFAKKKTTTTNRSLVPGLFSDVCKWEVPSLRPAWARQRVSGRCRPGRYWLAHHGHRTWGITQTNVGKRTIQEQKEVFRSRRRNKHCFVCLWGQEEESCILVVGLWWWEVTCRRGTRFQSCTRGWATAAEKIFLSATAGENIYIFPRMIKFFRLLYKIETCCVCWALLQLSIADTRCPIYTEFNKHLFNAMLLQTSFCCKMDASTPLQVI